MIYILLALLVLVLATSVALWLYARPLKQYIHLPWARLPSRRESPARLYRKLKKRTVW